MRRAQRLDFHSEDEIHEYSKYPKYLNRRIIKNEFIAVNSSANLPPRILRENLTRLDSSLNLPIQLTRFPFHFRSIVQL